MKYFIISVLVVLFFGCDQKQISFCYIQSNYKNQVTDSCTISYSEKRLSDTIKRVEWDVGKTKFVDTRENAIYESLDNDQYYMAYSFVDTINKNRSLGFFGESSTKLERIETFNLENVGYVVYKFLEEGERQESFYSYYTPKMGFFKYYYIHSGGQLTANIDEALRLLEIMKKNKDFTGEMHVKNPEVKLEDYLPPIDVEH